MSLTSYIKPWNGNAVRHLPDIASIDPSDFRYCAAARDNRWNTLGDPTLYLAKDEAVAVGEFARHLRDNRPDKLSKHIHQRRIWQFTLQLNKTLDLCSPEVCGVLSLTDAPDCFKEKQVARSTSIFLRNTFKIEAIFVPSMVFLDDLSNWCLVIFLENLPGDHSQVFCSIQDHGCIKIN